MTSKYQEHKNRRVKELNQRARENGNLCSNLYNRSRKRNQKLYKPTRIE